VDHFLPAPGMAIDRAGRSAPVWSGGLTERVED
jgi:hypothetical protein